MGITIKKMITDDQNRMWVLSNNRYVGVVTPITDSYKLQNVFPVNSSNHISKVFKSTDDCKKYVEQNLRFFKVGFPEMK